GREGPPREGVRSPRPPARLAVRIGPRRGNRPSGIGDAGRDPGAPIARGKGHDRAGCGEAHCGPRREQRPRTRRSPESGRGVLVDDGSSDHGGPRERGPDRTGIRGAAHSCARGRGTRGTCGSPGPDAGTQLPDRGGTALGGLPSIGGVVLIDGIEYLVSDSSFEAVLKFVRRLLDAISESQYALIISLGSGTVKEQELKVLEREMEVIRIP